MSRARPPWIMWGNTQTFQLVGGQGVADQTQLVRIAYARPDTWSWIFQASLVDVVTSSDGEVDIAFNLTLGVGRSQIAMPGFETYSIAWTGTPPIPGNVIWRSTSVDGGIRRRVGEAIEPANLISEIPAQDIQLTTSALYTSSSASDSVTIEVAALFAPKTHVRPEWFNKLFPGEEDQSR